MSEGFEEQLSTRVRTAAREWSPEAELHALEPVTKGSSSLSYLARLTDAGHGLVAYVKVAPPNLAPVRNRDVLRQARVMDVLHREGSVPVPRVLFVDPGSPPEVPPFVATAAVAGTSVEPLVDAAELPAAQVLSARVVDAAHTLARLHRVDPAALQGEEPGERADLVGEVERWARVFATVDGDLAEQGAACADRLRGSVPTPLAPVIVHGDFRLGNLVCDASRVRAVLDWEIWSLTDPRIDVAWFLMTLSARGLPSAIRSSAPGLPSPEDALAVYERATGAALVDLPWFAALSRFRAAAAMALNIKHNRRRPRPDPRIESYADRLPEFLGVATGLVGHSL